MIVIGDVHGEFDILMKLMDILPQTKDICFVGDLIDRGKDSKKVIDFIRRNNYKSVLGNHEDLVWDHKLWMVNGGQSTLDSFRGKFDEEGVPEWIESLPILFQYKNYLISHSFAWDEDHTTNEDLLWGRDFRWDNCHNFISIFGHTPMKQATKINNKHWCIDTGATYGNRLSAIDLDDNERIYFVRGDK